MSGVIEHVLADAAERSGWDEYDLQWYAFPEVWGSTALGFGGVGGQAITTAQTYIVLADDAHLYLGGQYWKTVNRRRGAEMVAAHSTR